LKLRLTPRETKFFAMFEQMCSTLQQGAETLHELLRDHGNVAVTVQRIKDIEHQGDELTHAVIRRLNQTFITPFDREDIHKLASSIDDVLDFVNSAAERMLIYKIEAPPKAAAELSEIIVRQSKELSTAVALLESKKENVINHCVEIKRLEGEADYIARKAIGSLFEHERDPIALIKLKEIYETLETATDKAEDAANVLESVVLKSA